MRHGLSNMGNDLRVFSPNGPAETKPSELIERMIPGDVAKDTGSLMNISLPNYIFSTIRFSPVLLLWLKIYIKCKSSTTTDDQL
jgi:hypothetical protein